MRTSLFLITLLAAGCGGSTDPKDMGAADMPVPTAVPTNFASINTELLQPTCTFSVCHSPGGKVTANALDLKDDDGTPTPGQKAYMALINQMSVNKKAKAMGLLRIKPCDSAHSFTQTKLAMSKDTDKDTDFGHHMPDLAGEFLTAAQVQAFADWIDRGAIFDEPASVSGSSCQLGKDMGPHHD